jgi:DNA repair exonuclease SbcCD ATPase subunit
MVVIEEMNVDYDKYDKKLKKIERGLEELMKTANEKSVSALKSKEEAKTMMEKVKMDINKYREGKKLTEEIIEKKMEELNDTNMMISDMERKTLMESQKKLDEVNTKIEDAKMDSEFAIAMNRNITSLRKMIETRVGVQL